MPTLIKPSPGNRTQAYSSGHRGVDYGWGNGRAVYAAASGNLTRDTSPGYGLRASVNHGALIAASTLTRYAHLSACIIPNGTHVAQGQLIGYEGDTGTFAKSTHLHFELLLNGSKKNPETYYTGTAGSPGTPIGDDMPLDTADKDWLRLAIRQELAAFLTVPGQAYNWLPAISNQISGITAPSLQPVLDAINAIDRDPTVQVDLTPVLAAINSVNQNIDDQPTQFKITPA